MRGNIRNFHTVCCLTKILERNPIKSATQATTSSFLSAIFLLYFILIPNSLAMTDQDFLRLTNLKRSKLKYPTISFIFNPFFNKKSGKFQSKSAHHKILISQVIFLHSLPLIETFLFWPILIGRNLIFGEMSGF